MTKKTDAWMPLWIGAYLADTQHLERHEHGGYLLLLMAYWRNRGPLLDDDRRLASIAKATVKEWRSLRPTLAQFFTVADGCWRHKRVESELKASTDRAEKAASKASQAAQARWAEHPKHPIADAPSNASSNAQSTPQAMLGTCPTPSSTSKPKSKAKPAVAIAPPDWLPSETWEAWHRHRGKMSEDTQRLCLTKLDGMRARGQDPVAVIEQSIANGWSGLFEIKRSNASNSSGKGDERMRVMDEIYGRNRDSNDAIDSTAERLD